MGTVAKFATLIGIRRPSGQIESFESELENHSTREANIRGGVPTNESILHQLVIGWKELLDIGGGNYKKKEKNLGKFPILSWSRMKNEFLVNFYVPQIEPPNERECYVGFGAYDVYLEREEVETCKGRGIARSVADLEASNGVCEEPTLQFIVGNQAIKGGQGTEAAKEVFPKIASKMEERLAVQVVRNEGENSYLQQGNEEVDKLKEDIA